MKKEKDGAPWYGDKPPGAKDKKKDGAPWYGDKPPGASRSAKRSAVKKMLEKK